MSQIATYEPFIGPGSGTVKTLTGDLGGAIPPDGAGNIDIISEHGIATHGLGNTIFIGIANAIILGDLSPLVGVPALEINTGDIDVLLGSIKLPVTDALSGGIIYVGGVRFISDFGTDNVFIGQLSGNQTLTGTNNTSLGSGSLTSLGTGSNNLALGSNAGSSLTLADSSNILIGNTGTIGDDNTIRIGTQGAGAGQQNKTFIAGINGVAIASPASVVIDTVTGQIGVNPGGGLPIDTITGNTGGAIPPDAAGNFNIVTANSTVQFAGAGSTETLDFGLSNLILGNSAASITSAANNVGLGDNVLTALTSGTANTAAGFNAMVANNSGRDNSAFGAGSLAANTIGFENSAGGINSLVNNISGSRNTAFGVASAGTITTGTDNSAFGWNALLNAGTSASFNTALGYQAGQNYVGTESSNIIIRNLGTAAESNTIRIGTSGAGAGQQNRFFAAGIDGVNVGSVATVVTEASDQLGTAVITAGTNISVTPGANTITLAATGAASFAWTVETVNLTMVINHGYIANKGSTLVLTLPVTAVVGSVIEITGINTALGWQIAQAAGQQIFFGTSSTTLGATGTLTSSAIRDSIKIVCVVADTTWNVLSSLGNISIV